MKSEFELLTSYLNELYQCKNADYGNSFDKTLDEFGLVAAVVRISDKINRVKTLIKQDSNVKDESLEDTLFDLASYSLMTILWLKNDIKRKSSLDS